MTAQTQSPSHRWPRQAAASPAALSRDAHAAVRLSPPDAGPAMLAQHAAMIACFWRDCQRRGLLDPECTLDILDLCAGRDGASELLVAEVQRRLKAGQRLRVRHLRLTIEAMPQQYGRSGRHDTDPHTASCLDIRWHAAGEPKALQMADERGSGLKPYRAGNPLVVIAHDAWSQLPQELFAMHYGRLLRANRDVLARPESGNEEALWQPATEADWDPALCPLIERYRTEFNSAPIVYPAGAFRFLAAAQEAAGAGLLVISLASGCTSDLALRLSSFAEVSSGFRQSGRLPVNFQLLGRWAGDAGGLNAEVDLYGHRVLQVLLFGPVSNVSCLEAVAACIDPALMSSRAQLAEIARSMGAGIGLDARLNLLQLSRCDPQVFIAGAHGMIKELARCQGVDKRPWRRALEQVWEHLQCFPTSDPPGPLLAQAAMHCGHWGLARRILTDSLQRAPDKPGDLANLAWCEARTGKLAAGLSLVQRALALDPDHALSNEILRRLRARAAARDHQWLAELRHPDLPLVLEPLDDSHAEALSHQYRDPQIAVMTGLPAMSTPEEVRTWMFDQQSEAGRVNYAVMHADLGFVGFINLAVSGASAFFCFWTGVDFQGMGFASAAGRLACRHAAEVGVPVMLTSAYKDNHRSIRALKRLGFTELAIRACAPDQDRIFFALIDARAGTVDPHAELQDYYRRENLPMVFDLSTCLEAPAGQVNEEQS